jgi:hypothetical protein
MLLNFTIIKSSTQFLFPSFFLLNFYFVYLFRAALYRLLLTPGKEHLIGAKVFSITKISITTISIMTLSITTLSITALSITTLSITTLSVTTLSITTLSITTFSITISKSQHSA